MCFKAFIHVRVQRGKYEMLIAPNKFLAKAVISREPTKGLKKKAITLVIYPHDVLAIIIKEVSLYLSSFSYILLLFGQGISLVVPITG